MVCSTLNLNLDLSLRQILCSAVRYFRANDMPGRLAMETGGFGGMIGACPTPELGLSYSFVRLPPLSRGGSPCSSSQPAFFPDLSAGVRCREISPPVMARFVGGHIDCAIQRKGDELVASLRGASL